MTATTTASEAGTRSADDRWYPANPAQKGLWVLDRVEQLRRTTLIPTVVRFTGPVDAPRLAAAVQWVLDRHPALRSRFRLDPERKRVEYRTDLEPARAGVIDAAAEGWTEAELPELVDVLCYAPFDLAAEAPARAELIVLGPEDVRLVLTVHHIVCDGWSHSLILREVEQVYRALARGVDPALPVPPHPGEVTVGPGTEELAERLPDVLERLAGAPLEVDFPFRRPVPAGADPDLDGGTLAIDLDEELTGALLDTAAAAGCTPFALGVALLTGTLAGIGTQRDFVIAFGWPGRDDPAIADVVGMFMNTAMLRVTLDGDRTTWGELLAGARIGAMEAFIDADVPLDAVTAGLKPERTVIWPPLSAVLVNLNESPRDLDLGHGVVGRLLPLDRLPMKYDLALFVRVDDTPRGRRLQLSVDFTRALFDATDIRRLLDAMRHNAALIAHSLEEPVTVAATPAVDLDDPAARLELVRSLWQEVLKLDSVGDDVNFFEAGGDSLLVVMLVERLIQTTGRALKTMDLFRAGTVRGHAELLATAGSPAGSGAAGSRDRLLGAARAAAAAR
ncbi:condensation domain-containing protein [Kitasatospora sp. NPDC057223]|uniref:condensation domain-containing protein n=1 Tax=Kitasatospora sp. NPDC057223 TaxID=3346055 RepID=UPI0036452552